MISKNFTIISLYFNVFIIISVLIAYFPLWLNKVVELDPSQIGYVLSIAGIMKVFFTIFIALFIRNSNQLRKFLIYIIFLSILLFLCVYFFKGYLSVKIILFTSVIFLISLSPILPLIETLYSYLVKESLNQYGKIRIYGSISFC